MSQIAGSPHVINSTELEPGGNVTFHCSVKHEQRFFHWYKQTLGQTLQTVASGVYKKINLIEPFNNSRFQVQLANGQWTLSISSVKREDEAIYLCQSGKEYLQTFIDGFFLAVKR